MLRTVVIAQREARHRLPGSGGMETVHGRHEPDLLHVWLQRPAEQGSPATTTVVSEQVRAEQDRPGPESRVHFRRQLPGIAEAIDRGNGVGDSVVDRPGCFGRTRHRLALDLQSPHRVAAVPRADAVRAERIELEAA